MGKKETDGYEEILIELINKVRKGEDSPATPFVYAQWFRNNKTD